MYAKNIVFVIHKSSKYCMKLSPFRGSGRNGSKSPKKNDRISVLEFHTAKLRSPMKRSMTELNKLAYKNAIENKPISIDESDSVIENELSILNKIIELSKIDGLNHLQFEQDEKSEVEISDNDDEDDDEIIKSNPRKKLKLQDSNEEELLLEDDIPVLEKTSILLDSPPNSLIPTSSPDNSPLKSHVKPLDETPKNSPTKSKNVDSKLSTPLRRSERKKNSVIDKLNEVSVESSPKSTRKTKRNLHSTFNSMNDLKPPRADQIKLMIPPQIEVDDDDLLITDPKAKQKALYHDGFEAYFEQNQTRGRISKSSMSMAPDITYEDYNTYNKLLDLICSEPIYSLNQLYKFQFTQWLFELKENFNLVFYGIGSKRTLLFQFLQEFVLPTDSKAKCIVINGYNTEFTLRMLLKEIWRICFKKVLPRSRELSETCNFTHLEFMKPSNKNKKLYILLNNIDGESLRNDDLQYMLSRIARIEQVSLICSLDNLNTPLFWDAAVLSSYNFIWHNISTFKSYTTEVSFKDPLSIGKTDEMVGSRGAKYVLSSLTGNAKSLYKNLILQQLEKIDISIGDDTKLLDNRGTIKGSSKTCISLREFYDLCVSEFIISNDISFRTILGEFVEHKMCTLTRDTAGVEILFIAFSVDELEKLLDEELMD